MNSRLILLTFVLMVYPGIANARQSASKPELHMIMGGEQFDSLSGYQLKQLTLKIQAILRSYRGEELSEYIDDLEQKYQEKYQRRFEPEEIAQIFEQMRDKFISKDHVISETSEAQINEMREILDQQHGDKSDPSLLEFDPSKVKTLVIGSSDQ